MKIITSVSNVCFGNGYSLGGSKNIYSDYHGRLESNSFSLDCSKQKINFFSIDSLYPGKLVGDYKKVDQTSINVFFSTHTHYSPMISPDLHGIGESSDKASARWVDALSRAGSISFEPDAVKLYESEVDLPIYRRFDYPRRKFRIFMNRFVGKIPNPNLSLDKKIYYFILLERGVPKLALIYHSMHPCTRSVRSTVSADYIKSIRDGLRERFGQISCVFMQGCAGDVRVKSIGSRLKFLPSKWLNLKFNYQTTSEFERKIDETYHNASLSAKLVLEKNIYNDSEFVFYKRQIKISGFDEITVPCLKIPSGHEFHFYPFEVSHLYHLENLKLNNNIYIVTCSNHVIGYLPYPSQHLAGGYEVDGSGKIFKLKNRIKIEKYD